MANNRRRIRSLLIGVVLGLWVLVIGTAVVWGLQNEETKLRDQVGSQLGAAGIRGLEIDVQGRDVFLAGAADADQRGEAERIVRGIEGIRTIEWDDLPDVVIIRETTAPPGDITTTTSTVAPDASATTAPADISSSTSTEPPIAVANISAKLDGGVLFLSGAVPDEESAARIAAVAGRFDLCALRRWVG